MMPSVTPRIIKPVKFQGGPLDGFRTYLDPEQTQYLRPSETEGYQHVYLRVASKGVGVFNYIGSVQK